MRRSLGIMSRVWFRPGRASSPTSRQWTKTASPASSLGGWGHEFKTEIVDFKAPSVLSAKPLFKQNRKKRKEVMNNKFDELTKRLAQSVTRRQEFKKLGVGL